MARLIRSVLQWLLAVMFVQYSWQEELEQFEPSGVDNGICSLNTFERPFSLGNRTCMPVVDDVIAEEDEEWQPWSFAPTCVQWQPEREANGKSMPPKAKYCVFTSHHFRGGRGISLVTTPELAANVAGTLDDSVVPPKIRDHPTSWLGDHKDAEIPYDLKKLPGRGVGALARRDIKAWETIVVGFPAVLAQMDFMDVLEPSDVTRVMSRMVGQLPVVQQEMILNLARTTGGGIIQDILQTNIYGVELDGVPHMALVPETARMNHGCRPNSFWRYNQDTLALEIVAQRDIRRGEEITHTYTPFNMKYEERKEALQSWGFACKCELCTSSKKQLQESDKRRDRIQDIQDILVREDNSLTTNRVDQLLVEATKLIEVESSWMQLVVFFELAARAYMRVGEFAKAEQYIKSCEERWQLYGVARDYADRLAQLKVDLRKARISKAFGKKKKKPNSP